MIAVVLSVLLMSAGEPATLTFGSPRSDAETFEWPLHAPARALHRIEKHAVGHRLVLFVPGVTSTPQSRAIDAGPVAHVKVASAQRGVALTLTMRNGTEAVLEQLHLTVNAEPTLRYRASAHPDSGLAASVSPRENLIADAAPMRRSSPLESAMGPARAASGKTVLATSTGPESGARLPLLATSLVLLVTAAGVVRYRQKRQARLTGLGASIDVVAVHSFGTKQKLVLVNTCGDRLLLATSDKEVRLLKNLGPQGADTTFADALNAADEASQIRPADIAGLLKLRERKNHDKLLDDTGGALA